MTWNDQFLQLYRKCLELYRGGNTDFQSYYEEEDLAFLASIGYKPRELFDFVEDFGDRGEPTESTALLIAAVRRDYFLTMQNGESSSIELGSNDIPSRDEKLDGIPYFPRILAKARAKLRGELDPNLMFCCGGDCSFFKNNGNISPADFLRNTWASGDNDAHIIEFLRSQKASS